MAELHVRAVRPLATVLFLACLVGVWVTSPVLAAATSVAAAVLIVRVTSHAVAHARLVRALRRGSYAGSHGGLAVRWRPLRPGAAVAGFHHPEIYCDPGLPGRLSDDELTAVLLHERHHQLRRDPLRLLVLSAVEPLLRIVPAGRRWLTRRRADIEVAADRFALNRGARRPALARALLKLGDATAHAGTAAFGAAQDIRLRALVDDGHDDVAATSSWLRLSLLATGLVAATCVLAYLHHSLVLGGAIGCALTGC